MQPKAILFLLLSVACFILAYVFYEPEIQTVKLTHPTTQPTLNKKTTPEVKIVSTPKPSPIPFQISRPVSENNAIYYKAFIPQSQWFNTSVRIGNWAECIDVKGSKQGYKFWVQLPNNVFYQNGESDFIQICNPWGPDSSQKEFKGDVVVKSETPQWFYITKSTMYNWPYNSYPDSYWKENSIEIR